MPKQVSTLYINTKAITLKPMPAGQTTHPDLLKWQKGRKNNDISAYKGNEKHTLYGEPQSTPYHKQKEALIESVREQVMRTILAANPSYVRTPTTMQQEGDKISYHMCTLLVAVAWLCDSVADKKWRNREAAFYAINTQYLAIMRELYGATTVYRDHANVACADHFIPEKDRFYGKRRKAKA